MIDKIRNEAQYDQIMAMIENFLQKATIGGGFHSLNEQEADELHKLSLLAEHYEDHVLKLMPMPVTINSVVQQKVAEMDITQKQLATMFNMGTSKLSQILNGKRPPDISFLKAVHEKLGVDGNFILEAV